MTPSVSAAELPLLHRLAILYLVLPLPIWLLGWFEWWFSFPLVMLLGLALWQVLSGGFRPTLTVTTLGLLLLALGWVLLTQAGGFLDRYNSNMLGYRAMFLDMARLQWPTYLVGYVQDDPLLLRYNLGWWMPPALMGKWFGVAALNWAVPLWTWGGVALVLLLFVRGGRSTLQAALPAALLLVLFGGLDALEVILHEGWQVGVQEIERKWGFTNFDWSYDWGPMRIEYPSLHQILRWSPHHFLAAGLGTLLIVQLQRCPRFLAASGVVLAAALFWSPFVVVGLLTLATVLLFSNGLRSFLGWRNLLVAPFLAGFLALYLTSGRLDFDYGWTWQHYDRFEMALAPTLLLAYLTEFLVLVLVLWWARPGIVREPFFIVSLGLLLITPLFYYGSPKINDLFYRSILPALFVCCYYAVHTLIAGISTALRPALAALAVVLAMGSLSVFNYVAEAFNNPGVPPYERSPLSILSRNSPFEVSQRVAPDVPGLLQTLLRDNGPQPFERGELIIRSDYDVYVEDSRLVYVNLRCNKEAELGKLFSLHVYPVNKQDLPLHRRRHGYDNLDFDFSRKRHYKGHGKCLAARELPSYDIKRIHTGQYIHEAGRDTYFWREEHEFER